jgi:hypothetical protein
MGFLLFVLRRARRHWQILLTLSLGVSLTTALLASGPLLVNAVTEMGLYLAFQSSSVADSNLRLTVLADADRSGFQTLDAEIQELLRATMGRHLNRVVRSAESEWMVPWEADPLMADQRVNLRFYGDAQDRVEFIAGGWPAAASGEPDDIQAVVTDGVARAFVLRVGDRLPLRLDVEQRGSEPDVWIKVAGIVRPRNPRDAYWFGAFGPLASQGTGSWAGQYNVLVSEETFFSAVSALFPGRDVELAWHALLQHEALSAADIGSLRVELAGLHTDLTALRPPVTLHTGVADILASFQRQLESIRVPLYILLAEVMLLALYYVTMVAALSMRQVEREFAILRSRGAAGWQIARIVLVEALLVLAVALVSGPWLGAGLVKGLAWVGPLTDVGLVEWHLNLEQSAWLAAGVGAVAGLAGLLLPLGPALRRSIVTHQQRVSRSSEPPWWQRLYLDVFLLVAGLVLLWRLRLYGEIVAGEPGGLRLDWLLLVSPLVFLLGAATVLLRVFPLVLRALAFFVVCRQGLTGALALWQTSRNPTHVTRLVLLLTLATALANLSSGLNLTLDQSETERARYLAGNDLRLVSAGAVPLVDLESAPDVLRLSGVWRGEGHVDLESTQSFSPFEILAIEPDSFADVTTYRRDFAEDDFAGLLAHLSVPEGQHPSLLLLPGQPARFGFWLWGTIEDKAELGSYARWIDGDSDAERVGVVAKLQTAQGELFTVELPRLETALPTEHLTVRTTIEGRDVGLRLRIKPDNQGWYYYEGSLPVLPSSSYPLSLHSLWFQNQATRLGEPIAKGLTLVLDDLTVIDAETQEVQVVEDFEAPSRTIFLNAMETGSIYFGLYTRMVDNVSRGSGMYGQMLSLWSNAPLQTSPMRLRQTWTRAALPALASPAFNEATELRVGDLVRARVNSTEVDFRIAGIVRHFPTLYEQPGIGYLVTSRDLLLALFNDTSPSSVNANEVLIDTDGRASIDSLSSMVPMLTQSWEAESVRKALKANPLALGLRAVTFFGSLLATLLSLVGFATHFYLSVRRREVLFGVMRAMGMSSRQLYTSLVFEQAVLVLVGLTLGTGLGVALNQITLPRLVVSLGDRPPIPPFVSRVDWLAVGGLYLFLVVAFLIILGMVTALLWRARVHRTLRIGQE